MGQTESFRSLPSECRQVLVRTSEPLPRVPASSPPSHCFPTHALPVCNVQRYRSSLIRSLSLPLRPPPPAQDHLYHSYFLHRQEAEWARRGPAKLRMLRGATDMLLCGEDLGLVPRCVGPSLTEAGILCLRIQRMKCGPPQSMPPPPPWGVTRLCVCWRPGRVGSAD